MKMVTVIACILSVVLLLGCGKDADRSSSGQRNIQKVGVKRDLSESKKLEKERALKMEEGKPVNVSDGNFEAEVIQSDLPVLVDFWAPWCRPCMIAAPVLEKIAKQYNGSLKVCKLNVDESRQTALKYGIMSIPTLNLYVNGNVVDQLIGVTPSYESDIISKIEPHI